MLAHDVGTRALVELGHRELDVAPGDALERRGEQVDEPAEPAAQ